jgi:multimeric flavodoxin WrbA
MDNLYIILPKENISMQLDSMVSSFTRGYCSYTIIKNAADAGDLRGKKLLFAMDVGDSGFDLDMLNFIIDIRKKDPDAFSGSTGTLLIHSSTELGTKRFAQDVIFLANSMGCAFIGHPMVEATGSLRNFMTWQKTLNLTLEEICLELCGRLGDRFLAYKHCAVDNPKILVLYSSPHKYSNTLNLWRLISDNLRGSDIKEIQIENGTIADCRGCSFTQCQHHSKRNTCFYGGFMVENVLPSIEEADCVIWLCPNYNDSFAANLTATINRLTVLYHKQSFHKKSMYGVVVSGNSGSDSVGKQLIGALNLNKGFRLPPYAIFSETANDPGSILKVKDVEKKASLYAEYFKKEFKPRE